MIAPVIAGGWLLEGAREPLVQADKPLGNAPIGSPCGGFPLGALLTARHRRRYAKLSWGE